MNKKVYKFMFFAVLAAAVTGISGCKSKPKAGMYGDDSGLYGGDILDGDIPIDDPGAYPADGGNRDMFAPIMFAYDSSQVNPEEAGKVEAVATHLKKNRSGRVIVEGHGDERGSREYNLALGERRALAIRDYLINLGVDPGSVQTKSLGEEMPVNMGHDEGSWRLNRRGVFAIY